MNITITIAGPLMSGKSTIAQVIKEALIDCDIEVTTQSTEHSAPFICGSELKRRMRLSNVKPKVIIQEFQTPKS